jgi:nucleosome binding factor SPN SPT16 subunit
MFFSIFVFFAKKTERELRKKLNLAFKTFADKVESITNNQISFEIPFRDLSFNGTPFRSMVNLMPTSSSLINVTEWPPFILTLDDIELVHFERVGFSLKNFDMVFCFKDYTKKVAMVTSIPMSQLEQIKDWLNSCDIHYTEGIQNFNWPKIMKTIVDDPEAFFETGGWTFLEPQSDEETKDEEISDEDDDVYAPTDDESEYDDSDESDYSESDEDDDSDASGLESDEESGKDWSDLEEEARKHDEEQDSDDSDRNTKSRKRPANTKASSSSAKKSRR